MSEKSQLEKYKEAVTTNRYKSLMLAKKALGGFRGMSPEEKEEAAKFAAEHTYEINDVPKDPSTKKAAPKKEKPAKEAETKTKETELKEVDAEEGVTLKQQSPFPTFSNKHVNRGKIAVVPETLHDATMRRLGGGFHEQSIHSFKLSELTRLVGTAQETFSLAHMCQPDDKGLEKARSSTYRVCSMALDKLADIVKDI